MKSIKLTTRCQACPPLLALFLALFAICFAVALQLRAAESVSDKVSEAASDAVEQIEDAGKAAGNKMQELWHRIDERRLKNRTPDQIVAWAIMGLLAGGLIHQMTRLNKVTALFLGLVGAFIGGIIAHVTGLDLGMGPVLIRYEDLLFSLAGAVLILLAGRVMLSRKKPAN